MTASARDGGSRRALLIAATTLLASSLLAPAAAGASAPAAHAAQQCPANRVCEETVQSRLTGPIPAHVGGVFPARPSIAPRVEHDSEPAIPQGTVQPPTQLGPEAQLSGGLPAGPSNILAAFPASLSPVGFVSTDLGEPPEQATPQEPTAAEGEKVVWYTGNDSVVLSLDAGKTFKYFSPATMFPEKGLQFCCDQVVSYSPKYKLFVWVLQYWCGPGTSKPPANECEQLGETSNRLRIAVASPAGLRKHPKNPGKAWHYWNITPNGIATYLGGPEESFDQTKMALNSRFALLSTDLLGASSNKYSSILMRIELSVLAARKKMHIRWIAESHQKVNVAQDINANTAYFVGNPDLRTERILSWPNGASGATPHEVVHVTIPRFNAEALGTTGKNWYGRWATFPGSVESATLSGGNLIVAQGTGRNYCVSKCSSKSPVLGPTVFKQPAVLITKYSVSTWTLTGERFLYNNTYALTWPALQVDGVGDVGIALRAAAKGHNPQPIASFLEPGGGSNPFLAAEPEGLPQETGDFYSLRPGRTSKSFVMTAQTVQSNGSMHWDYVEWGRGAGQ